MPNNTIFAGNPAKIVKELNSKEFNTREDFFKDPKKLAHDFDMLDKYTLKDNTFLNWLKSIIYPDDSQ